MEIQNFICTAWWMVDVEVRDLGKNLPESCQQSFVDIKKYTISSYKQSVRRAYEKFLLLIITRNRLIYLHNKQSIREVSYKFN